MYARTLAFFFAARALRICNARLSRGCARVLLIRNCVFVFGLTCSAARRVSSSSATIAGLAGNPAASAASSSPPAAAAHAWYSG
eukprot:563253-Prorocentrum_minimum.AAC.1